MGADKKINIKQNFRNFCHFEKILSKSSCHR